MPIRANLEKLAHGGRYFLVNSSVKSSLDLLLIALDQAQAHDQRLSNASKTFGLKVANNALGNVVGRKNQGVVHGGFRM